VAAVIAEKEIKVAALQEMWSGGSNLRRVYHVCISTHYIYTDTYLIHADTGKNVDPMVFLLSFIVLDAMTLLSLSGIFPFYNGVLKLF
jgi:hypothetical protein